MWKAIPFLLIGQVAPVPTTAAEAARQAHADLAKMPPAVRPYLRYLSLHHLSEKERATVRVVLDGHCNQLSRVAILTRPARVGVLLRVNLQDYGWAADVWERLQDPYFSVVADVIVEHGYGYYTDKARKLGWVWTKPEVRKRAQLLAPWLSESAEDTKRLAEMVEWTGSRMPVVRGDWFFNATAASAERGVGYYDFLGIKTEKDFQDLIGFDAKKKRRKVEIRESVAESGVGKARAIVRETAEDQGYWKTFDFRLATGKANPLKNIGRGIEEAFYAADVKDAATEQYGGLANGLWATFLGNNKGERQDVAPDFVGKDGASHSNDGRIHINVSCMRCHIEGGLQNIDAFYRNHLNPPLELRVKDYAEATELRQMYLRQLEPFLKRDRATFEDAVKEATGLTAKAYSIAYGKEWERYEDAKVDAAWAARDLGMDKDEFQAKLLAALKAGYPVDDVVSVFIHKGARARTIGIRNWEEVVPEAYAAIRGAK